MTALRPVIIGTGLIAQSHVAALLAAGVRDLVVWSPDRGRRERFAASWGATAAPTLEAAVSAAGATHVHVCSTPMQHLEPIEAGALSGLTIVCEKPLAPTRALAQRAFDAASAAGVAGWVGFNRRLEGGVQEMRRLVVSGAVGRAVSVSGHYRQQWNASPSGNDWRYDPAFVGPSRTITEIGSHWFDLVAFAMGAQPVSVAAQFASMGERDFFSASGAGRVAPVNDDLFSALLRYDNGATAVVHCTELAHGSFDELEVRIDGTLGSLVWTSAHPNLVRAGNKTDGLRVLGMDSPSTSVAATIAAIYDGSAGEVGVATFAEGVSNAATLDAVRVAAESRQWVTLSDVGPSA